MVVQAITLLTLTEVADRLRKSPAQLRWMIHSGTAPKSALIGGRRMFRESDIEDYINQAFDAAGWWQPRLEVQRAPRHSSSTGSAPTSSSSFWRTDRNRFTE